MIRELQAGGDAAIPRARCSGDAGEVSGRFDGGAGVGDAVAGELGECGEADGTTRIEMRERVAKRPMPGVELVDMRLEFQQTWSKEQLFSAGELIVADAGYARSRRAGGDSAEPAWVLVCGDVPELWGEDRVRELRDLDDVS